jgi:predicted acetyltransferase
MANPGNEGEAIPIELIAATQEREPILADLLELYSRELGPLFGLELRKNGRFGYANLPLYWTDPLRYPFLVRVDGELAGFALVCRTPGLRGDEEVWDMAEFFVMPEFRKQGIGTRIAHEVWRGFPGAWQIRVLRANQAALHFWQRAAKAYAPDQIETEDFNRNGKAWVLLTF